MEGFFSLVQALQKEGALSLDRLYTIAADYPSFGNGVFCAVLPLYLYLIEQGIGEDDSSFEWRFRKAYSCSSECPTECEDFDFDIRTG